MENDTKKYQENGTDASEQAGSGAWEKTSASKLPSGLRRTVSTELVTKQVELRALEDVKGLIERRTWAPGEVIIQKGDTDRDLFFFTEGIVEIWSEEATGSLKLNEMKPPNIFGDVAFLSGLPRTVTAKAKTEVHSFILKYENFMRICKEPPDWLSPLLVSFVNGIKALHKSSA